MRTRLLNTVVAAALAVTALPLLAAGAGPAGPAGAACKSPMKPGSWTGTVTQEMVVQGTATSGMEVDATGRSSGDLSLKVKCNAKVTGTFGGGTFTIDGTFSLAGFSTPLQCTGTTGERPAAGKVRKGSAKLPVIDLTYGEATDETFDCGAGPFGDALSQAFAENDATTATTTPGAPTGIRLPATDATKTTVSGASFEATGGFDPIAISTGTLEGLGLTPRITQAFALTRG